MAGFYPDVPGPRMAFDRDGTTGFQIDAAGAVTALSAGDLEALNDETASTSVVVFTAGLTVAVKLGLIFPELRDIDGYFVHADFIPSFANPHGPDLLEWSDDTTNGLDGTWHTVASPWNYASSTLPDYRSSIQTASASAVKALRWAGIAGDEVDFYSLHVYGSITSGQNPDRLRIWEPVSNAEVDGAYFDWGDVAQDTTEDRTFRVKNNSATLTANTIVLDIEALTDTTPSVADSFELSDDGVTFGTTVTITSLAPGAISSVLTVRRTTPSNAVTSVWSARVTAVAGSWT